MAVDNPEPAASGVPSPPGPRPAVPTHSTRPLPRPTVIAAGAGAVAALTAIGVGTLTLLSAPGPTADRSPTLQPITVTAAPTATIPLSESQIIAVLDRVPDFGPLTDARHRSSCLGALGYRPDTAVLGAQPIQVDGRPAMLLLLPGEQADTVVALAVAPNCNSADTGLVADTIVHRR